MPYSASAESAGRLREARTRLTMSFRASFNLAKSGTATISVGNDATTTSQRVGDIVKAFNDIVSFVAQNNTVTQSTSSTDREVAFGALGNTGRQRFSLGSISG